MADNVIITPGSGATIRADEIAGSIKIQVVKIALGADGVEDLLLDSGQQTMANSLPVALPSNQSAIPVSPFAAILEGGLTELVGINEQIDQNDYSGSVDVIFGRDFGRGIVRHRGWDRSRPGQRRDPVYLRRRSNYRLRRYGDERRRASDGHRKNHGRCGGLGHGCQRRIGLFQGSAHPLPCRFDVVFLLEAYRCDRAERWGRRR